MFTNQTDRINYLQR